ncbi:ROK family protein [Fulvivirga ligni]|uniref:ROK family protein n=1 Tax=Fulvivirga ligni TaxID=2904246 RepID=UPI001F3952A5|nr:ROK family protein [Fulvivirga ligni]UII22885.1 ROK family protein [Fulvivirga ligni]
MLVAVGIDVGGTNTKLGLVTKGGKIINKTRFRTRELTSAESFANHLILNIRALLETSAQELQLVGIGIGAPMANIHTGLIAGAANLQWSFPADIRKPLSDHFAVPVKITNDANLAAIGEKVYGNAITMENFLSVTIGTGLGCGVFTSGQLQHGESDLAGELGHTSVKKRGRQCSCGKRGCLETYVSARGVITTAYKTLGEYKGETRLRSIAQHDFNPAIIDQLAREGDGAAIKIIAKTADTLGFKLADVVAMYNPEAIFITGGVANSHLLIEKTLESIKKYIYKTYSHPIQVLPSALKDDEIAVLGGAAIIWSALRQEEAVLS